MEVGLIVLSGLANWLFSLSLLDHIILDRRGLSLGCAASIPMFIMFALMLYWPIGPLRRILRFMDMTLIPLFQRCTIGELLLISVLAGFGEELAFRGVLQVGLGNLVSPTFGIIVSAVIFGALHWVTTTYAIIAGLIGLYFSLIFVQTENLMTVIFAHALYDFFALVYLVKMRST